MNISKKKKFIIFTIFAIFSLLIIILEIAMNIPKKELISTKTYDIYELTLDDYIYYSYVDDEQKVNKCLENDYTILKKIYLGDKNQVTVESWGRSSKISEIKLQKFHVTEETYKELSEKYEWEDDYNITLD